mgnify:CR=1 FL=1
MREGAAAAHQAPMAEPEKVTPIKPQDPAGELPVKKLPANLDAEAAEEEAYAEMALAKRALRIGLRSA